LGPTQQENANSGISTVATMAMSTNRKTMDGDREFEQLKSRLLGLKQ
jgi:cytochrome c biogenesis protein